MTDHHTSTIDHYQGIVDHYTATLDHYQGIVDQLADQDAELEDAPMLHWSRPAEPDLTIGYNHVTAETPFGRFLITWKGWKDYDAPAVDETPWGGYWNAFATVAGAKRACETTYNDLLAAAYEGGHS